MNTRKTKRWVTRIRVILMFLLVVVSALLVQVYLTVRTNQKNAEKTTEVLLNQVVAIIERNKESEKEMTASLKEEYILRAKAVAYILDSGALDEKDTEELVTLAEKMGIDEIHLFNENGEIYAGTNPEYYGFDFDSGEQIAYFRPMLGNRDLSMCQDVTPNTAEGKSMMYAICWNEEQTKMVQVGITPTRFLQQLRRDEIPNVVDNIPSYEGLDIYIADPNTRMILGATNKRLQGRSISTVGLPGDVNVSEETYYTTKSIDGVLYHCHFQNVEGYIVGATYSTEINKQSFVMTLLIELVYILIFGLIILIICNRWLKAKWEQDEQYAVLKSMSDIYYSMHLINLLDDSVMELNARDEVKRVADANRKNGATTIMTEVMRHTVEPDYMDAVLEFSDLTTIAERMKGKKVLSGIFRGIRIGWFLAYAIAIEVDQEGRPTKIVFTTRSIDEEKRREEKLIKTSNTDELTGFYNRRAYENDVTGFADNGIPENFVYVSMDLNGLKTTNDTKGHAAGDELICGACECMQTVFGENGKLYRIGGDEFVVLMIATDEEVKTLKQKFATTTAGWKGAQVPSLSVSVGYVPKTEFPDMPIREIAKVADQRMYEAKRSYYAENGVDRRGRRSDDARRG